MFMSALTFFTNPVRFFARIGERGSVRKGLAVLAVSAFSQILASFIYSQRVVYDTVLGPYSLAEINLFRPDYLVMSSLTTVFVALVIVVGLGRISGRLLGKQNVSMKVFITASMNLLAILALANLAYAGLALQSPSETYYVLGAEFRDVLFYNVSLRWAGGDMSGSLEADVLYAKEAYIERVSADDMPIQGGGYTVEEINRILTASRLRAVLNQPQAPPHTLPQTIEVEEFSSTKIEAKNVVLTSVAAVVDDPGTYLAQLGLAKNFGWRFLTSIYLGLAVYTLHKTRVLSAILIMVLAYLALTNLVPVLF